MTTQLVTELRALRRRAGQPTLQVIAGGSSVSASTVSYLFRGLHTCRWRTVRGVVTFLGGNCEEFLPLWEAASGKTYPPTTSPRLRKGARRLPRLGTPLTEDEKSVLNLLSFGNRTRMIAEKTGRKHSSVKDCLSYVYARLGARDGSHAVRLGIELGYIELPNLGEGREDAA